jgi:hypothetical protein
MEVPKGGYRKNNYIKKLREKILLTAESFFINYFIEKIDVVMRNAF